MIMLLFVFFLINKLIRRKTEENRTLIQVANKTYKSKEKVSYDLYMKILYKITVLIII